MSDAPASGLLQWLQMRLLPPAKWLAAGLSTAIGAVTLSLVVSYLEYEWDDWLARGVRAVHGPVEVSVVNATAAMIPEVNVGIAGWFCMAHCVRPGDRVTCRPEFGQASMVMISLGGPDEVFPNVHKHPPEQVPVWVNWRSHGKVELTITDAGVLAAGQLSEELF